MLAIVNVLPPFLSCSQSQPSDSHSQQHSHFRGNPTRTQRFPFPCTPLLLPLRWLNCVHDDVCLPVVLAMAAASATAVIARHLSLLYTSALLAVALVTPICGHTEYLSGKLLLRPDRGAEYCDERFCLSLCVFICLPSYHTSDLHQMFCACYLWPLLGPPLAA